MSANLLCLCLMSCEVCHAQLLLVKFHISVESGNYVMTLDSYSEKIISSWDVFNWSSKVIPVILESLRKILTFTFPCTLIMVFYHNNYIFPDLVLIWWWWRVGTETLQDAFTLQLSLRSCGLDIRGENSLVAKASFSFARITKGIGSFLMILAGKSGRQ